MRRKKYHKVRFETCNWWVLHWNVLQQEWGEKGTAEERKHYSSWTFGTHTFKRWCAAALRTKCLFTITKLESFAPSIPTGMEVSISEHYSVVTEHSRCPQPFYLEVHCDFQPMLSQNFGWTGLFSFLFCITTALKTFLWSHQNRSLVLSKTLLRW